MRIHTTVYCLTTILAVVAGIGCSDNDTVVSSTGLPVNPSLLATYFPTEAGSASTFEVVSVGAAVDSARFEVGQSVTYRGRAANYWIYDHDNGPDTNFIVVSGSSVLLYERSAVNPEKILQAPLTVGTAWMRYPVVSDSTSPTDTTSIVTGDTDLEDIIVKGDDPTDGAGDGTAKVFPTEGSDLMWVDDVETITLASGRSYANCVRISNSESGGAKNYYWFAPNVGLVKYVIGATDAYPNGYVRGELVRSE